MIDLRFTYQILELYPGLIFHESKDNDHIKMLEDYNDHNI